MKLMQIVIPIQVPECESVDEKWGSNFQGAIMDYFPSALSDRLHNNEQYRPYSQYLKIDNQNNAFWVVNSLTDELADAIQRVYFRFPQDLFLRHETKKFNVTLQEPIKVVETTYEELAESDYPELNDNTLHRINFVTSTSFRSNKRYVVNPLVHLFIQSLHLKWLAYAPKELFYLEKAFALLEDSVHIFNRDTIYTEYSVKGCEQISSFKGTIELQVHDSATMHRALEILLRFGNYSGVGIKTTRGMGGFLYKEPMIMDSIK